MKLLMRMEDGHKLDSYNYLQTMSISDRIYQDETATIVEKGFYQATDNRYLIQNTIETFH